jgi:signal transduction histidine kinase
MRRENGVLELVVLDDGVGFALPETEARSKAGQSFGILGMRERAELAGGKLAIESTPGSGTCVRLRVPALNRS